MHLFCIINLQHFIVVHILIHLLTSFSILTSLKFIKKPFSQRSRFSGLDTINPVIHVSGFVDHLILLSVSSDERILSLPNNFTLKLKCNKETFQIKMAFKEMLGLILFCDLYLLFM